MRNALIHFLPLICAMPLACSVAAADPQSTPQPADASAQQPSSTTSSTPSAAPTSANNKTKLVDNTVTDAQLKHILAQGYRPEGKGDQVLYCRREPILGSHFEQKACRSATQILFEEKNAPETMDKAQRTQPAITGN